MKIAIIESNKQRIEKALNKVQKRSRARDISVKDIFNACKKVEKGLGVTKTALKNTRAYVDLHAQAFPRAYNGVPESTQFSAIYNGKNWVLVDIYRGRCTQNIKFGYDIRLSEKAKECLLYKAQHLLH